MAGRWYVNVLATYPEHRGRGHGPALVDLAGRFATETGRQATGIIAADTHTGARRLYERSGCREIVCRTMVKDGWDGPGKAWVLLVRDVASVHVPRARQGGAT